MRDIQNFLVAGEDTTVIEFEVSGNNSVQSFVGINGPQFYYTTTDGKSHKVSYILMLHSNVYIYICVCVCVCVIHFSAFELD